MATEITSTVRIYPFYQFSCTVNQRAVLRQFKKEFSFMHHKITVPTLSSSNHKLWCIRCALVINDNYTFVVILMLEWFFIAAHVCHSYINDFREHCRFHLVVIMRLQIILSNNNANIKFISDYCWNWKMKFSKIQL